MAVERSASGVGTSLWATWTCLTKQRRPSTRTAGCALETWEDSTRTTSCSLQEGLRVRNMDLDFCIFYCLVNLFWNGRKWYFCPNFCLMTDLKKLLTCPIIIKLDIEHWQRDETLSNLSFLSQNWSSQLVERMSLLCPSRTHWRPRCPSSATPWSSETSLSFSLCCWLSK